MDNELHCPDPECKEPQKKNKRGDYPKHCPECDTKINPTGQPIVFASVTNKANSLHCPDPDCNKPVAKNKKGKYPKHCPECDADIIVPLDLPLSTQDNHDGNGSGTSVGLPPTTNPTVAQTKTQLVEVKSPKTRDAGEDSDRPPCTEPEISGTLPPSKISIPQPAGHQSPQTGYSDTARVDLTDESMTPSMAHGNDTTSNICDSTNETATGTEPVACPHCYTDRKRSKKGTLARFCRSCKHDFLAVPAEKDVPSRVSTTKPDHSARTFPNKGEKSSTQSEDMNDVDDNVLDLNSQHFASGLPIPGASGDTESMLTGSFVVIPSLGENKISAMKEDNLTNDKAMKRQAENMSDGDTADCKPKAKTLKTPEKEMADLSLSSETKEDVQTQRSSSATAAVTRQLFPSPLATSDPYSEDAEKNLEEDSSSDYLSFDEDEAGVTHRQKVEAVVSGSHNTRLEIQGASLSRTDYNPDAGLRERSETSLADYLPQSGSGQNVDEQGNAETSSDTQRDNSLIQHLTNEKQNIYGPTSQEEYQDTQGLHAAQSPPQAPPRARNQLASGSPATNTEGKNIQQGSKSDQWTGEHQAVDDMDTQEHESALHSVSPDKSDSLASTPDITSHPDGGDCDAGDEVVKSADESNKDTSSSAGSHTEIIQPVPHAVEKTDNSEPTDQENTRALKIGADGKSDTMGLQEKEDKPGETDKVTREHDHHDGTTEPDGNQPGSRAPTFTQNLNAAFGKNSNPEGRLFASSQVTQTAPYPGFPVRDQHNDTHAQTPTPRDGDEAHDQIPGEHTDHEPDRDPVDTPATEEGRNLTTDDTCTTELKLDDTDIDAVFKEYRDKIIAAKESRKLHGADEQVLDSAYSDALSRYTLYTGNKNSAANVATRKAGQRYDESVNGLKNFINKHGHELNKIFASCSISKVYAESVQRLKNIGSTPAKDSKQSRGKYKVTFHIMLSQHITKLFQSEGREPIVEIRSNINSFTDPLLQMRQTEGGLWVGSWFPPPGGRRLRYKYFVYDGLDGTDDGYEWLGESRYGPINRFLDIPFSTGLVADMDVYDGAVLMKNNSKLWKRIVSKVSSSIFNYATVKDQEHTRAITEMLPKWINELENGKTVEDLLNWIGKIKKRQLQCISSFADFVPESSGTTHHARKVIDKAMEQYHLDTYGHHLYFIKESVDIILILSSLIGLLDTSRYSYNTPCFTEQHLAKIADCVAQTMERVGLLLDNSKVDLDCVLPSLSIGSKYLEELTAATRYTIKVLQEDILYRSAWLWLIPVLQLLKGSGNLEDRGVDYDKVTWWGVGQMKTNIDNHRRTYLAQGEWKVYLQMFSPFFLSNEILPYSFLAILTEKQLEDMLECEDHPKTLELPVAGVIACVRYHAAKSYYKRELIGKLLVYLHRVLSSQSWSVSQDDQSLHITESLLLSTQPEKSTDIDDTSLVIAQIYILLMDGILRIEETARISLLGSPMVHYLDRVKYAYDNKVVIRTTTYYYPSPYWTRSSNSTVTETKNISEKELEHWKSLFGCGAENSELVEWWLHLCSKTLKGRLDKVAEASDISVVNLYCTHDFEIPMMDQTIADAALLRAEKLLESDTSHLADALPDKVGKLVNRALSKAWNSEDESNMNIVKNMVKWGNFISVWKFFNNLSDKQKKAVDEENHVRLGKSVSALEELMNNLVSGNIRFDDFTLLSDNEKKVLELCEISKDLASSQTVLQEAFEARRCEQQRFKEFHNLLAGFWASCRRAIADREEVDEWLRSNVDSLLFNQCITPTGQVICDFVPTEVKDILQPFLQHNQAAIFQKAFDQLISRAENNPGDIEGVVTMFVKAKKKYDEEFNKLNTGDISIDEMEKLVRLYFEGSQEKFFAGLKSMLNNTTFNSRRKQITLCSQLEQYHRGAEVILELKEKFGLTGDFTDMKRLLESANKQLKLKDISEDLVRAAQIIKDIEPEQIECLYVFLRCEELIEWVRAEVLKKDISNFVDLASSTLGEDDQAAHKTRVLLNALTGYSPLIYDLAEIKSPDYKAFIQICQRVWDAMKTNKALVKNLEAANAELEWLKKVKTHFGNVEMKSIAQATAINKTGLYSVGNIQGFSKDFKTLDDVIMLRCTIEDKDEEEKKTYRYSELKDLQSKLTLVAGEQQEENKVTIQRFDTMRDAVENLARAYIDIRREGCIQFDDMLVVVHCNPKHRTAVEVRLQSIGTAMIGQNSEKDPIRHCEDLYRYMQCCIEDWRKSMNNKRSEYPELNFYSTEQLVVLRKELGTFLEEQTPQSLHQALPLLAMIHPVDPGQLHRFITTYDPRGQQEETPPHDMETGDTFLTYDKMSADQRDLVDEVQEEHEDFTELLAIQAINELGEEADLDTMIDWIETYKYEQRGIKEQQAKQAKMDGESALQTSHELMKKIMTESKTAPLQERLNTLWDRFIEHTGQSIKYFLGIPHLGHVLNQIQSLKAKPTCERILPPWLHRGKPCLVPTPQSETYRTILTIYAHDKDFDVPTRNEVLICNPKTRVEEVRLFLSRALNDPVSFYCVVNCHLLGYDVCRYIETRLSNTADDKVKTYGLAFLYAQEKRDARIKAYLDNNLVKNVALSGEAELQDYVQRLLTLPGDIKLSACSNDPNRSGSRLIRSNRAGVGKSLKKFNLCNVVRRNKKLKGEDITIPIYKTIDTDSIIARLNAELGNGYTDNSCHTIHIDIAHEVDTGADELLFNLCILRSIVNSEGVVWQAQHQQYYIIECMPHTRQIRQAMTGRKERKSVHEVMDYLPTTWCVTPTEAMAVYASQDIPADFNGFDQTVLMEQQWQIVIKYLDCHRRNDTLYQISNNEFTDEHAALQLLIRNCGLRDPTWSELRHYVYFLSNQLNKVEHSPYCGQASADVLPGFRAFVVRFMFRMAEDFATRSLKIAEETPDLNLHEVEAEEGGDNLLDQLAMKRTWESGNHPYLFFNEDGETFSPLGFFVENRGGNALSLVDCQTKVLLVENCMSAALKAQLDRYQVPMSEDFNALTRPAQLTKLRNVMVKTIKLSREVAGPDGALQRVEEPMFVDHDDPDPNYVLTMDNAKKILAIHQRLRVEIPVIIMGETGCGKTKLIDFMSKLQVPTALKGEVNTMVIVKIHGGTTENDIIKKVEDAQRLALQNQERCRAYAAEFDSSQVPTVYTILFLDEANTTEAIGLVKEILCDGRIRGSPLRTNTGLKIIAACNPYRRHSPEMIEKLKKAGLGYNVGEDETKDKFGQIPMRHLVYRVQALSQSLLPLVWDFGTLKSKTDDGVDVECAYIRQMIIKFNQTSEDGELRFGPHTALVAELLTMTQTFMREQEDECSFVSLRDVQRLLSVANWFYRQRKDLFKAVDATDDDAIDLDQDEEEAPEQEYGQKDYTTRSLILAIGVCYLARLEDDTRDAYAAHIGGKLEELIGVEDVDGKRYLEDQIERCQNMFIREVIDKEQHLNIATNKALKENVFMMIICIENRIPLFVVGKPGSSKSLSKSMVIDSMKGTSSKKDLFKKMKRTYMVSFQCSRHATPAGIVGVFKHCANFQKGQDMDKFVAVVVLDEVGLAEDSENMPLKTLHPLLEDGCEGNEKPEPYMKCAFVGISNWALDPAKMNRGIFVQRGTPNPEELTQIATEICKSSQRANASVNPYIDPLARGYLAICKAKKPQERELTEFFGLRDFYSLMKMVVNFADKTGKLNRNQLEHSIRRNFGGFDPETGFDPMVIFSEYFTTLDTLDLQEDGRPPIDSIGLIKSSLSGKDTAMKGMESRYLLILTENLSVLSIILNEFSSHDRQPEVVFGSKFREDVSFTQVCQNIYRIKTCMDIGKPVILLNLDDLYESLYDALNQYFSTWGERKFVDLGLGTHRVKTFVSDSFRLVVIADKNKVHSKFPIPLINRLEKHYVSATSLLTDGQKTVKRLLEQWTKQFVRPQRNFRQVCPLECDFCKEKLETPYALPCRIHYLGPCCKDKIRAGMKCQVKDCDVEMPADFDWVVDSASLENRQYFENSTLETAFIGYSTETTALAVRQATEDVEGAENAEEYRHQILQRAQYYMLLCSTGEAVMRLDRTDLDRDAKRLQEIYLHEQYHETLLQYLDYELFKPGAHSLLIQVTSFAELMSSRDVKTLSENLNPPGTQQIDIFNIYLKDYAKEDQFTSAIRLFYARESNYTTKLLLVQCEAADENTELLDSVRFIVQRESEVAEGVTHTVLLLNLPRGRAFTGYQGGKWSCVHIDDPRSPEIRLPSLSRCMELTPSQIIAKLLPRHTDPTEEIEQEAGSDDEMRDERPGQVDSDTERPGQAESDDEMRDERPGQVDSDTERPGQAGSDDEMREHAAAYSDDDMQIDPAEGAGSAADNEMSDDAEEAGAAQRATPMDYVDDDDDEMPPLEDDDMPPLQGEGQKTTIPDDEYPDAELDTNDQSTRDVEMAIEERPVPLPRLPRPPREHQATHRTIREDDDELMLADLLKFVIQCLPIAVSYITVDCHYERVILLTRILERNQDFRHIFLRQVHTLLKNQEENSRTHWVKADAAKASNMKQSETMRHALENSLERAFVPGLAAVITFIDVRMNLVLMDRQDQFTNLWLHIFDKCDRLGLEVDPHTHKLPKSFRIQHEGDGLQDFSTQFPFSWITRTTINKLIKDANSPGMSFDEVADTVFEVFKTQTPIGRVVYDDQYRRHHGQLLDNYIKDFVYLTHPCSSSHEHWMVGFSIMKSLQRRKNPDINLVHVHLAYEELKAVFSNLSAILSLTWKDEKEAALGLRVKKAFQALSKEQPDNDVRPDLLALHCLMQYLSDINIADLLTNPELWADRVEKSKHIVRQVLNRGEVEGNFTEECRVCWSRLMLKKLYVEHVIIPTEPDSRTNKRKPYKLSFFVKHVTGSVFQEFQSFDQVVTWLREAVIDGVQKLYQRCPKVCTICNDQLHSPVLLPCQHIVCDLCVNEVRLCPAGSCGAEIPEGFIYNPDTAGIDIAKLNELKWLRKRLNKFFMAFVAEVIFGADTEPDGGILQWLLDCITFKQGTREFSLYNTADVVDPTPVLRSFLLKLLLQCNRSDVVQNHLDNMFAEWNQNIQNKVQTMVLLMDCRKDFYQSQVTLDDIRLDDEDIDAVVDRIDNPSVDILRSVAELQCLLSYGVASLNLGVQQQATNQLQAAEKSIRHFLQAASQNGNSQPGYYLTRQLLASRGESFIKDLMNTPHNYLIPDDVKRDLESFTVPDVLSVYGGQQYRAAKTAIDEVIAQSNNADAFTNAVNQLKLYSSFAFLGLLKACKSNWLLLNVVFTRITRTFVQRARVQQNVTNGLWDELSMQLPDKERNILGMLLRDGALPPEMDVNTARGINLSMLVLSLLDCMCNNQPMSDLNPLSELINQPMEAAHHFLPTMMDNQYELHAEQIRRSMTGSKVTIFECPQGHPYFVDNCGQPMETKTCLECGDQVGGANHRALAGNQAININDRRFKSDPGHILGAADRRSGPIAERDLSALSCTVLRCLVHLCMYTGALFRPEQVAAVITKPVNVQPNQVRVWLESHIKQDIRDISQCCGNSDDECILLLHELIHRMKGAARHGANAVLNSIQLRKSWEAQFDTRYVRPTFEQRARRIQEITHELHQADDVDLKRILSTSDKPVNEGHLLASPALWEYKQSLTISRVKTLLDSLPREECPTLKHMVDEFDSLTAVRLLPDILELMKLFSDKFHSKLKREEAASMQIGQFCRQHEVEIPQIKRLSESFIIAWNIMVTCHNSRNAQLEDLDITSPLSSFLLDQHSNRLGQIQASPTSTLIKYLSQTQNRLVHTSSEENMIQIPLSSINSSNVITVESGDEVIGIILSHSEYEMRETTTVRYNWRAVEREIVMRYKNNKPILDFTVDQLQYYVFQEDFNLHNQLKSISDSQEWLSPDLQVSITSKLLPRVPTLTAHLKKLQVAINFLYGTRIEGDNSLADYMTAFAPDLSYLPNTIKLKHVRDVWLLLKYTQTDLLMRQHQEPFDDIDTECRDALPHNLQALLADCTMYNSPRTKLLLQEMFKYIILRLNKAAASEGDLAEKTDASLDDALRLFIEYGANTDQDDNRGHQILEELPDLPAELLVKHTPKAWSFIWTRFTTQVE